MITAILTNIVLLAAYYVLLAWKYLTGGEVPKKRNSFVLCVGEEDARRI
jgi:hypothetical protein